MCQKARFLLPGSCESDNLAGSVPLSWVRYAEDIPKQTCVNIIWCLSLECSVLSHLILCEEDLVYCRIQR